MKYKNSSFLIDSSCLRKCTCSFSFQISDKEEEGDIFCRFLVHSVSLCCLQISPVKNPDQKKRNKEGHMATRIVSFILRVLQIIFSCFALGFLTRAKEEYDFVAFSFLLMIMGLMVPWSLTLAFLQGYSELSGYNLLQPRIIRLAIIIADAVLSLLSLAAACSAAAILSYLPFLKGASDYKLAALWAFFTWIVTASTSLISFWLFHSM